MDMGEEKLNKAKLEAERMKNETKKKLAEGLDKASTKLSE
jgi:hypothetical protein